MNLSPGMSSALEQKRKLKPEQATAAYTLDRHISVTAGPGAGKTTVLVERYLHILRQHKNLGIDQIVAITFTNRAANEMRERLRAQLDELLHTAPISERHRWVGYKRTLDGAIITTIHGFCARLLRDFPVETGIDPQFVLLDEHQAAVLLEAAVEESLTEFITSGHETISRLTAGVGRSRLAVALAELYRTIRGQGLSITQLGNMTAQSHSRWEQYRNAFANVEACMNELISVRTLSPTVEEKRSAAARGWPGLRQMLLDQHLPVGEFCRQISEFRQVARPDARGRVAAIVKQLDECFWGEKREKAFGFVPRIRFDLFAGEYSCELIKVLESVNTRLEDKKQQLAALDFDDLQLRVLKLLDRPEALRRVAYRYKFFLVDEFQDTNSLQRDLMDRLALTVGRGANLFIVGDRKQSIYGFRGADVDVFREMTAALIAVGGALQPLNLNFRSQAPLVAFFNLLFNRLFEPGEDASETDLKQLGYVEHDPSEAQRAAQDPVPLVELMITTEPSEKEEPQTRQTSRERDAAQLAWRIISLVKRTPLENENGADDARLFDYRDIALLFRALTDVPVYEAQFRRANIPYQTVQGKGFYEREEITDLIQLLRFLDNCTDELALAAVLRSPLSGISDNTLLALRLAPQVGEEAEVARPQRRHPRKLFQALREQRNIAFIAEDERIALEDTWKLLQALIERRNRFAIGDLLRYAVDTSEYTTVISATFDGAQRLANVQKLFSLAERFERSGAHLIRDFVRYVHDFETIGSRESEGEIDESANAVKLMTIHQVKGLEFPVVILPDLHRSSGPRDSWFLLDRHLGLTLRVPDGRGEQVAGTAFRAFSERAKLREQFESTRLLYVAATRARDRLILSGVTDELTRLEKGRDNWLKWIWQALELKPNVKSGLVELAQNVKPQNVKLSVTLNLSEGQTGEPLAEVSDEATVSEFLDPVRAPEEIFTLLRPIPAEHERAIRRFSVTQLINYRRCPRQYYFDRLLHAPAADEIAVWNDAEAPEPPANLTATLKGAVIHRFCETYTVDDDINARLRSSFADVISSRLTQFADRLLEIDPDEALKELLPLAQNYLASDVFQRVERARWMFGSQSDIPGFPGGLWSELRFSLRRPLGVLTGTVDKLLISPSKDDADLEVEIIDFKTNRIGKQTSALLGRSAGPQRPQPRGTDQGPASFKSQQIAFDFSVSRDGTQADADERNYEIPSVAVQIRALASDYELQMQAYALAVRELLSGELKDSNRLRITLHFLEPNIEFHLSEDLSQLQICTGAIDTALFQMVSATKPKDYPARTDAHCRMCNFPGICSAGQDWLGKQNIRMEGR